MKIHRIQPGLYRTPDGLYEIQYEEWWLDDECECVVCQAGAPNCPNDGYGKRSGWTVWDVVNGLHVTGEPFSCDTYREAREYLVEHLDRSAVAMREP